MQEPIELILVKHWASYTDSTYPDRIGWGHSTLRQLIGFADQAGVENVVTFHHDPEHSDDMLDEHLGRTITELEPDANVIPGMVGTVLEV